MLKIAFFVLVLFVLITPGAFAQDINRISLKTDKDAYVEGDVITISGKINQVIMWIRSFNTSIFGKKSDWYFTSQSFKRWGIY